MNEASTSLSSKLALMVVPIFLAITASPWGPQAATQLAAQDPAPVRAATIKRQIVQSNQTFAGTVTPIRKAIIGSAVEGRVIDVMVEEGDRVNPDFQAKPEFQSEGPKKTLGEQGVPLAQLRTETIDIEIAAAQAELTTRSAALAELEASLPSDLELATANVKTASSQFALAQRYLERIQSLVSSGRVVSESELEDAQSSMNAAELIYSRAKSELTRLENTTESRLSQARAQVDAQAEAVRLLEDRKRKYTIRAPFPGVISARFAEIGQWLSVGAEVAEVVQMDPIDVVIQVPQGVVQDFQLSMLRAKESGDSSSRSREKAPELSAEVLLGTQQSQLLGKVVALVPNADLLSRSFPVKVRVENPQSLLGYVLNPGMLVQVRVAVGEAQEKLLVDKDALVLNNEGQFLAILDRTSNSISVRMTPIEIGEAVGNMVEVRGDFRENDWVVVEGNERLRSGQEVAVLNAEGLESSLLQGKSRSKRETVATSIELPSGSIAN
jgi:HlyD family secretion protein